MPGVGGIASRHVQCVLQSSDGVREEGATLGCHEPISDSQEALRIDTHYDEACFSLAEGLFPGCWQIGIKGRVFANCNSPLFC